MKQKILLLLCVLFYTAAEAQISEWKDINNSKAHLSAQMLSNNFVSLDTIGIILYSGLSVDSLVGAQIFISDTFIPVIGGDLDDYMVQYNETDTLRAVAKFILAASQSTLLSFDIQRNYPGDKLMDIGIKISDSTTSYVSFTRLIIKNSRVVVQNLYAQECYLPKLLARKETFYDSLLWD